MVETITKSGHGVMGVLWSFELHDDLAAPYDDLPDVIKRDNDGYLCSVIGYSETPLGIPQSGVSRSYDEGA